MVTLLVALEFVGRIHLAGKDLPCHVVRHLRILLLQFLDQPVHLRAGQEVHHLLLVLDAEPSEVLLAGAVDVEHYLPYGILVASEPHPGLGVLPLVDVYLYDVAEHPQGLVHVLGFGLRYTERAFALRKAWHVCIENVEKSPSCRCFPCLGV